MVTIDRDTLERPMIEMVVALVAYSILKRTSGITPSFDWSETGLMAAPICSIPPLVDENDEARPATCSIRLRDFGGVRISDFGLVDVSM